ncbi:hypothetical protein AV926_02110 [Myroides marinus]|uniref:Inhibitor I9 domain-containing protein n=1 Tax=Myroides marinus TaxID=703342 RepID=A0A161S5D5_9FLAO|nr:hypothetical protein [Myroides marinus]KZE74335.1 hypothetical protein AV926_02110 [Myroides marinus]
MRKIRVPHFILVFIFIGSLIFIQCKSPKTSVKEETNSFNKNVVNNVIIYYSEEISLEQLKKEVDSFGGKIIYDYNNFNAIAIQIPSDKSLEQTTEYFQKIKGVLSVNKDEVHNINQ